MKKSLSLLVAIAMVFSMFATVVSAADEKQTAGEFLQEIGVIKGNQDGDLKEDQTWKRQDIVVLLSRLLGVEAAAKGAENTHEFTDVTDANYNGYISWAVEEGLVQGKGNGKFGFGDELKNQEFFALVLRAFGEEIDYADVPAAAIEYGFATEETVMSAIPLRGATYETIETALNTEVPGTGKKLGEILNLKGFEAPAVLALGKVVQTGKGEITVNFNKAATEEQQKALKFTVENGLVKYTVTTKWAEDGKSVVLSSNYLPAAVYTVTVGEFDAVEVTVVDEVATKLEIGATSLQKAEGQDLKIKLYNQFDKEVENAQINATVYNATYGKTVTVGSDFKINLSGDDVARVDDTVVVTASHYGSGLNTSKSFKVVAGSSSTAITLAVPAPLKDKTRISVTETDIVLPYTMTDQYGGKVLLNDTLGYQPVSVADRKVTLSGITFLVNDPAIISELAVDKDGVLKFKTGSQHGLAVVSALNPATGAYATISFKVESKAKVKTFALQNPGVTVAANEEVKIPFTAVDTFGAPIAAKDVDFSQLNITSAGAAFATGFPKLNAKGELVFKFASSPTVDKIAYIYVLNSDHQQAGSLQLDVRKDATKVRINGLTVGKYFANTASAEFKPEHVTYLDSYNRTIKLEDFSDVNIVLEGTALTQVGSDLVADASATGTVTFKIGFKDSVVANSPVFSSSVEVIKIADVKDYTIKAINTLYAGDKTGFAGDYDVTVKLVGKHSNGSEVVINQTTAFDFVTSDKANVVAVDSANLKKIRGADAGTAKIAAYKGSTKLAEVEVTSSKDKPVATTVKFEESEYTITLGGATLDLASQIKVKDQYGVDLTGTNFQGFLSSDDKAVVSVTGTVATAVKQGSATLTYITTTGAVASTVVYVELPTTP